MQLTTRFFSPGMQTRGRSARSLRDKQINAPSEARFGAFSIRWNVNVCTMIKRSNNPETDPLFKFHTDIGMSKYKFIKDDRLSLLL